MSIVSVDNIQPIGSGTSVTVNSAATLVLNNVNSTGVVTATSFHGDGSSDKLTLASNGIMTLNGSLIVDQVNINDNVIQANTGNTNLKLRGTGTGILEFDDDVTVSGIVTATSFSGSGVGLTSINTPSFAAKVSGTTDLSAGVETTIIFDSEDHDTDNAYNNGTGEFTVPTGKGGKYFIAVNFGIDDPGEVGDIVRVRVFKNGGFMQGFRGQVQQASANIILTTGVSGTLTLADGDVIKCMAYTDSNVGDARIEIDCCYFTMFRLSI